MTSFKQGYSSNLWISEHFGKQTEQAVSIKTSDWSFNSHSILSSNKNVFVSQSNQITLTSLDCAQVKVLQIHLIGHEANERKKRGFLKQNFINEMWWTRTKVRVIKSWCELKKKKSKNK